jgi:hypothetical protein
VSEELCRKGVWRNRRLRQCTRPVKADGLCGPHLAAAKREANRRLKESSERSESEALHARDEQRLAALGLKGYVDLRRVSPRKPTGYVRVRLDDLEAWVAERNS